MIYNIGVVSLKKELRGILNIIFILSDPKLTKIDYFHVNSVLAVGQSSRMRQLSKETG